jgi:hypothetical protein
VIAQTVLVSAGDVVAHLLTDTWIVVAAPLTPSPGAHLDLNQAQPNVDGFAISTILIH